MITCTLLLSLHNSICGGCQEITWYVRQTKIWKLPNYLFLNAKRFIIDYTDPDGGIKNTTLINFPEHGLDLAPYMSRPLEEGENALYDFRGVILHPGAYVFDGCCTYHISQ